MTDDVGAGQAPGREPPGHDELRASDADRERVAEQLREALAEGRLDMAEFEERLDAAYRAKTYGALTPLTRDLPSPSGDGAGGGRGAAPVTTAKRPGSASAQVGAGHAGYPAVSGSDWSARVGGEPTSSGGFAVMGGFVRQGRWTISRVFTAFTLMGGGEIDLREASFEDHETVIRCFSIMGGVEVTVPPGLNVQVSGFALMGGFDSVEPDGDPDAPRVKITGFALMGGVGVVRKRTRAEKQRLREERQLDAAKLHQNRIDHRETLRHELEARREHRREIRREARVEARRFREARRADRRGRSWRHGTDDDYGH